MSSPLTFYSFGGLKLARVAASRLSRPNLPMYNGGLLALRCAAAFS